MSNENNMIHIFAPRPRDLGQIAIKMHHRDFEISMSLDDSAGSSDHLWRGDVRIYDRRVLEASHSSNANAKADVTIEFYGHNQGGETTLQGLIDAVRRINAYYDRGQNYPMLHESLPADDEGCDCCADIREAEAIHCPASDMSENETNRMIHGEVFTGTLTEPARMLVNGVPVIEEAPDEHNSPREVTFLYAFALSNGRHFALMLPELTPDNKMEGLDRLLMQCDFVFDCAREKYIKNRGQEAVFSGHREKITTREMIAFPPMDRGQFERRCRENDWQPQELRDFAFVVSNGDRFRVKLRSQHDIPFSLKIRCYFIYDVSGAVMFKDALEVGKNASLRPTHEEFAAFKEMDASVFNQTFRLPVMGSKERQYGDFKNP